MAERGGRCSPELSKEAEAANRRGARSLDARTEKRREGGGGGAPLGESRRPPPVLLLRDGGRKKLNPRAFLVFMRLTECAEPSDWDGWLGLSRGFWAQGRSTGWAAFWPACLRSPLDSRPTKPRKSLTLCAEPTSQAEPS